MSTSRFTNFDAIPGAWPFPESGLSRRVASTSLSSGFGIASPPEDRPYGLYELGKRLLDLMLSFAVLVTLSPMLAIIAALIRSTSPGPVLFRQKRVGQDGALFTMHKFRTMRADAPTYECSPTSGADPRITRVGRFLRRTSLDELPQLLNVFRGQMSLVGPRPEMPFIVEQYTPSQRQRLGVKPGITGLWQVSPHRSAPIHEHLEYDLYYLQHRGAWLDTLIVLQTFVAAARGI